MQQGNFVEELRTSYNVLQSTLAGLGYVANPRKDHMEEIRPSVRGRLLWCCRASYALLLVLVPMVR